MSFSWQEKLAVPAEPVQPLSLGEIYRAHQASKAGSSINGGPSGSAMYSLPTPDEVRAAALANRVRIYAGNEVYEYKGLSSYGGVQRSKHEPRPDESADAFLRRVDTPRNIHNMQESLPADEFERVVGAIEQARQQVAQGIGDHDALRERLEHRSSGTGIGLFSMNAGERAAAVQQRPVVAADPTTERSVPMSMAQARQAMNEREAALRAAGAQRQELPTGSSGTGIFTR